MRDVRDVRDVRAVAPWRGGAAVLVTGALLCATAACGDGSDGGDTNTGPRPTHPIERDEEAESGPYDVRTERLAADKPDGFHGGTLYYPADKGSYAVVAAAPGLGADESMVTWYGELLASYGFVTLTMNTATVNDSPDQRGTQILDALDHIVTDSPAASRADGKRLGVLGHSMGGGGALAAAAERPAIRAAIPLTPYYEGDVDDWSKVTAATLIIGGEVDEVAPNADHAEPLYEGLGNAREKAYLNLDGDHFIANAPSRIVTQQVVGWLQRFLDTPPVGGGQNDHRGALCPPPAKDRDLVEARGTCPHDD